MVVFHDSNVLINNVRVADSFFSRLIGLLNKKSMSNDEGLLLMNCSSVHCFFMKFTIDVVYLSSDMVVVYKETIKPWKIGKIIKNVSHVLELAEGSAQKVSVGDRLVFID